MRTRVICGMFIHGQPTQEDMSWLDWIITMMGFVHDPEKRTLTRNGITLLTSEASATKQWIGVEVATLKMGETWCIDQRYWDGIRSWNAFQERVWKVDPTVRVPNSALIMAAE